MTFRLASEPKCVSFAIHDVKPATTPLGAVKTPEALEERLWTPGSGQDQRPLESCCDYVTDCVKSLGTHPLIGATHLAYSEHRPLTLSPDMIWVAIVQGLAQHIHNRPESFRDRLVDHSGKRTLRVTGDRLIPGSPENLWENVVRNFSEALRRELGERYERFVSDFSTTGPAELTACQVALMDLYEPFFEFELMGVCGIPRLTLEGTVEDWSKLRAKVDLLDEFDLEWWTSRLRVIADQFVRTASGDVDLKFWRNIHKFEQAYGPARINGWMAQLFPYLDDCQRGDFSRRNPIIDDPTAQVTTWMFPSGISSVPLTYLEPNAEGVPEFVDVLEILGGFVGVEQNAQTLELRPKLGWGVRRGSATHRRYHELLRFDPTPPVSRSEFQRRAQKAKGSFCDSAEFRQFYRWCDGLTLFPGSTQVILRPLESFEVVSFVMADLHPSGADRFTTIYNRWLWFGDFADGSFAAIAPEPCYRRSGKHWLIAHVTDDDARQAWSPRIIAWSFHEFLDLVIQAEGRVSECPDKGFPPFKS